MKKKGFTLIELLAVIVVLAIIALIATPIVMNTIKNSKKGAAERGAENYIKQVETSIATSKLDNKDVADGTYTIDQDGNLTGAGLPDGKLTIEMSGEKPKSGTIVIKNGQVDPLLKMIIGDYGIVYNLEKNRYEAFILYKNGEVVYFNVTTGEKCSDYTESQSNTGVKTGCMKFYAFNDDGGDAVNLLLDHNTTAIVTWNSSGSNTNGPKEVLDQLKTDTSSWKGTIIPANYTMDQTGQTSNANYTIDYSEYKARLITANEIAKITGNTTWDEKTATNWYYLDTNTTTQSSTCKSGNTSGCKYGWLYDRTGKNCKELGCLNNSDQTTYGYWTSSSRADVSTRAWGVEKDRDLYYRGVTISDAFGIRPVITIPKSQLG